jgi:hypothetical protein
MQLVQDFPSLRKDDQLSLQENFRWQLEEHEVGVRWVPPCEVVDSEAEELPPLEGITKQSSADRN